MWRGIADGHVDIIGTDHIHRDVASKAGSVWTASPGCPGLETMLPVMLSEGHHKRGIGLTRIAALTAGAPMTRQAMTKHLRVLEDAGLVASERAGREARFA